MPECHKSLRIPPHASNHVLVDGQFSCDDVQDLLMALLDGQVNQHKLLALSSVVRTETPLTASKRSIEELSQARAEILQLLAEARSKGLAVRARSTIELVLEDEPARTGSREQLQDVM